MSMVSSLTGYFWPRQHFHLIRQFVRREVQSRYRTSLLGSAWILLTPVLMLAVYTLVFKHIFHARWGASPSGSSFEFALYLYAGLVVFNFFADCVTRAPGLVLAQPNLVKKVVFPLEILPWVSTAAATVHLLVALALLLVVAGITRTGLPLTVLAIPLVWLPLFPLTLGLGWLLAALGVFLRDVSQALNLFMSLIMFLSPVFYPIEALPVQWRPWLMLNPLTLPIEETRHAVLDGIWPHWPTLALHLAICLLVAVMGAAFFHASRREFADAV